MEYMTIKDAAEKWGITQRRIQVLCAGGSAAFRENSFAGGDLSPYGCGGYYHFLCVLA